MKLKPFYLLLIGLVFALVVPRLTLSQSTPSSKNVSTESSEAEEKVKDIRDALKEQVKEKIEEVKSNQKKKGFFGELKEIAEKVLTIHALGGERLVKIGDDTEIVLFEKDKKTNIKFEDLALGDFIIVMGYSTQNGSVEGKRLVVTKKAPDADKRLAFFGEIQSLDKTSIVLKIAQSDDTYQIKTDKKTIVQRKIKDKIQKIEVANLTAGDIIIVIGTASKDDEKIIEASLIKVVSSKTPEEELKIKEEVPKKSTPSSETSE
jgi:hypothetical protein